MKVRVYYNLNRDVWSIKAMEGEFKGKVIGYAGSVHLKDAKTIVSAAGRQRVLREKRKNVHAYIEGTLVNVRKYRERLMVPLFSSPQGENATRSMFGMTLDWGDINRPKCPWTGRVYTPMYYNPYKTEHFQWGAEGSSCEGQEVPEVYLKTNRTVYGCQSKDFTVVNLKTIGVL